MSALQIQVAESLEGLSDENLSFLLEMICLLYTSDAADD